MTALAVLWLLLSKGLPGQWGKTASLYGYGLSGLSHCLLWSHLINTNFQSSLGWVGFLIPLTLTLIGRYRGQAYLPLVWRFPSPWPSPGPG